MQWSMCPMRRLDTDRDGKEEENSKKVEQKRMGDNPSSEKGNEERHWRV